GASSRVAPFVEVLVLVGRLCSRAARRQQRRVMPRSSRRSDGAVREYGCARRPRQVRSPRRNSRESGGRAFQTWPATRPSDTARETPRESSSPLLRQSRGSEQTRAEASRSPRIHRASGRPFGLTVVCLHQVMAKVITRLEGHPALRLEFAV